MTARSRTIAWSLVVAVCAALTVAGCDAANPVAPAPAAFPSAPNTDDEDIGDGDACPSIVPPEDCVPLTQAERQQLWWDIQNGIKWWNGPCGNLGAHLQDFVTYRDIRKYAINRNFWPSWAVGFWDPQDRYTGAPQISFDWAYHQGWPSEAVKTLMHEATHSYRGMGSLAHSYDPVGPGTYWVEDQCINW